MRHTHLAQLLAITFLVGACSAPTPSPEPTRLPASAEPSEPIAGSAMELLDCDGPVSTMGGSADDFGPEGTGSTPDEAFQAFLDVGLFTIPRSGYERLGAVGNRVVYVYRADERTKVVVVISDRFSEMVGGAPFAIDELRTCDPSEYGGGVDMGPGRRVWTHETTGRILTDIAGPGHCDWQSARMLHLATPEGTLDKQYVRDPEGVFDGLGLLEDYAEGVELPADATFSGYRTADGQELWFTPEDVAAYVVTAHGVERWPRADPPIGCA
jgi:hypothetical protein